MEHDRVSGGTLCYSAPEIIFEGKYSKASDVYSLGILLGELFTQEVPFDGEDVRQQLLQGARPILSSVPPPWKNLIERCVRSSPSDRPSMITLSSELSCMHAHVPSNGP